MKVVPSVAGLLCGVALGVVVSVAVLKSGRPPRVDSSSASSGAANDEVDRKLANLTNATARLEGKLLALETKERNPSDGPKAPDRKQDALAPPPTAQESQRHWQTMAAEKRRAHDAEVVDPVWASATSKILESDLGPILTAHRATVSAIDCRSTSCTLSLEWENYARAVAAVDSLTTMQQDGSTNCRTFINLPEPDDRQQAYKGVVILDNCLRRKSWVDAM